MNLRSRGTFTMFALAAMTASVVTPIASGAAPIDEKRAEAAALQDQIEANGEKISVLAEQINQAQIRLDEAQDGIEAASTRIDEHRASTADLKARAQARAVVLYRRISEPTQPAPRSSANATDFSAVARYLKAANLRDDDLVDQLRQATEEQRILTKRLNESQATAKNEQAALKTATAEIEVANAQQQETLNRVNGELQVLVEQERIERERRAAEAYARQQEAAQRRAQEKAASDATSTTSVKAPASAPKPGAPSSGSNSSSSTSKPAAPAPPPVVAPPVGNSARVQTVINFLYSQLGKPYVYGGSGTANYDCSGLVQAALNTVGIYTPHGATAQGTMFPEVPKAQAQPGDIFMFNGGSHDGIYIGNGQMIHSPQTGDVVKISPAYRTSLTRVSRPPY